MHFRTRNRVIQVIRTIYDPATKKPKAQVLGSLSKANPEIPDELRLSCKPAELLEIKAYIKNQASLDRLELELAARTLVRQMEKACVWLDTAVTSTENEILAAEIWGQLPFIRKKLQRLAKASEGGEAVHPRRAVRKAD